MNSACQVKKPKQFPENLSDPLKMYLGDVYTVSVNLAGLPGISVPCGVDSKGLPIGLQLIGDCFKEKNIIRAAYSFEQTRTYQHSPAAEAYKGEKRCQKNMKPSLDWKSM